MPGGRAITGSSEREDRSMNAMPVGSRFLCANLGVDKAGIIQHHLKTERPVAFVGMVSR